MFCGTVMEKYPSLQARTQRVLDRMTGWTPSNGKQRLELQFSYESAIFGAAVAVAVAVGVGVFVAVVVGVELEPD